MSALLQNVIETMTKTTTPPTTYQPKTETVEQFLARGGKIQMIVGYPDSEGRVVPRTDLQNAPNAQPAPLRYP